ncbi:MAG: hypothetical protein ACE5HI_18065, partial [bacterium]
YFLFAVLSLYLTGFNFNQIFSQFGFFPCLYAAQTPLGLIPQIVFAIGCIFLAVVFLITNTAVSRATFMVLKGNNFYSWREAITFALKKAGSTILTPIAIGLLILSFVLGAWVVGLLGRIPYIGELGVSLFTVVWIIAALFVVYLIVVTGVAFILTPAILATTDEDAFEAVFQSFSATWSQPWRIVLYEGIVGGLSTLGFLIMAIMVKSSFLLMNNLFSFSMESKYVNLAAQAQYLLQSWTMKLDPLITSIFGSLKSYFYFARDFIPLELAPTIDISAYLFSISMIFVAGLVVSYLFATFNAGTTITYLVIKKLKDDENLLERKEENWADTVETNSKESEEAEQEIKDQVKSDDKQEKSVK